VVEGGELWAQKRCESKLLMTALQSHAYITKNLRATRGHPLGVKPHPDFEERSIKKKCGSWNLDSLHK
jgi:hypothetical protein